MKLVKTVREYPPLVIVCVLLLAHALVMLAGGILQASGDGSLLASQLYVLEAIWPLLWTAGTLLPVAIAVDKSRSAHI